MGDGEMSTVKLTTLVGFEGDEQTGNDSYIGALATVEPRGSQPGFLRASPAYYAARRHQEAQTRPRGGPITPVNKEAGLVDSPLPADVESRFAQMMDTQMKLKATAAERALADNAVPAFSVQAFRVAGGGLHYYVRANWKSGKERELQHPYSLGAWISSAPSLRILAVERRTTGYGDLGLPILLNVVDLGAGRTGIIVRTEGDDSTELLLAEYRDGAAIKAMRVLQSIGAGE